MNENLLPDLKNLWHEEQGDTDYAATSKLAIKEIEAKAFRIKLLVASEVFAMVLVVSFLIYRIYTTQNWLNQAAYGVVVVSVLAVEALLIYWRQGLWHSPELSILKNAEFHLAHARLKLRMARFTIVGGPLGLALGFGMSIIEPTSPGVGFIKVSILLALMSAILIWGLKAKRKAQANYHQAQAIYVDVTDNIPTH